jgi:hypothetical protein
MRLGLAPRCVRPPGEQKQAGAVRGGDNQVEKALEKRWDERWKGRGGQAWMKPGGSVR